jgi:hypothetical protein
VGVTQASTTHTKQNTTTPHQPPKTHTKHNNNNNKHPLKKHPKVRRAGAKRVYLASAAPPVRHPNVYGVDMPSRKEFVANGLDEEEVRCALRVCVCVCECRRVRNSACVWRAAAAAAEEWSAAAVTPFKYLRSFGTRPKKPQHHHRNNNNTLPTPNQPTNHSALCIHTHKQNRCARCCRPTA